MQRKLDVDSNARNVALKPDHFALVIRCTSFISLMSWMAMALRSFSFENRAGYLDVFAEKGHEALALVFVGHGGEIGV